jgi:hypothetical protein
MCSTGDNAALPALGFPIRESTGQRLFSASPWLIAAVHALHRLLVPRHPPCALTILTVIRPALPCPCGLGCAGPVIPVFSRRLSWRLMWLLCSFQGPRRGVSPASSRTRRDRRAPVSQNSTACWTFVRPQLGLAPSSKSKRREAAVQPGSVDMLGPTARVPTDSPRADRARARTGRAIGAP